MTIFIDPADKEPGIPELGQEVKCERPDCPGPGENWLSVFYGFAGGGLGPYSMCHLCEKICGKTVDQTDDL